MDRNNARIFCQIVADTARCQLLAEDEATLAFMDVHPARA